MSKQTAGRDQLGDFAPKFAELNDDVLFGQVWSRESQLSLRDRSLVTICIFMGKGLVDSSLKYHLISAKNNGITREEMAEISSLMPLSMQAGPMPGRSSSWRKKYMRMTTRRSGTEDCLEWGSQIRILPSILLEIPI